jgi:hypothetical protein
MKWIYISMAMLAICACSTETFKYNAIVSEKCPPTSDKVESVEYTSKFDHVGVAWLCGITFILYGGACWAYLAYPTDREMESVREDGRGKILALKAADPGSPVEACVRHDHVTFVGWSTTG